MSRHRWLARRIRGLFRDYPAVALVGPRQAGKTTLARSFGAPYFDLEQESDRTRLDIEWPAIEAAPSFVVLDEAQAWPVVFPRLRAAIDRARRRNGRFLLLGSVSPALMREVSESLAGRLAICELTPFLAGELRSKPLESLWLYGGFPDGGILAPRRFPEWQENYVRLIVERDLPAWGLPARPQVTHRLVRMLAASHGTLWNASAIGQSLGLSYHTVNSYLDFIEGAFLIRRLPPFFANVRKRLVKSPKVYLRDPGVLHALLGAGSRADLLTKPWVGASWEGFVIDQVLGHCAARGVAVEPFFFRTSDGYEVDLILRLRGKVWAIEVKLSTSVGPGDFERLAKAAALAGADRTVIVSWTREPVVAQDRASTNLPGLLKLLLRP